jgi:hypothetical protein
MTTSACNGSCGMILCVIQSRQSWLPFPALLVFANLGGLAAPCGGRDPYTVHRCCQANPARTSCDANAPSTKTKTFLPCLAATLFRRATLFATQYALPASKYGAKFGSQGRDSTSNVFGVPSPFLALCTSALEAHARCLPGATYGGGSDQGRLSA